jgi:hypothetical protein
MRHGISAVEGVDIFNILEVLERERNGIKRVADICAKRARLKAWWAVVCRFRTMGTKFEKFAKTR